MGGSMLGGHEILNHLGAVIRVTRRTIRALDMCHYLRRDHQTGLRQFKPDLVPAFLELEGGDHHSAIFTELGPDLSGPGVPMCNCRECSGRTAELDHARLSKVNRKQQVDAALAAVRTKRGENPMIRKSARSVAASILALVVLLACQGLALAVGSGAATKQYVSDGKYTNIQVVTFTWTGDADDGTVPATAVSDADASDLRGWYVTLVRVKPGSTGPTSGYDITLTDSDAIDVMNGALANLSSTAGSQASPPSPSAPLRDGRLTLNISGQTAASATGTVRVYLSAIPAGGASVQNGTWTVGLTGIVTDPDEGASATSTAGVLEANQARTTEKTAVDADDSIRKPAKLTGVPIVDFPCLNGDKWQYSGDISDNTATALMTAGAGYYLTVTSASVQLASGETTETNWQFLDDDNGTGGTEVWAGSSTTTGGGQAKGNGATSVFWTETAANNLYFKAGTTGSTNHVTACGCRTKEKPGI